MTPSAMVVGASPGNRPVVEVLDESGAVARRFDAYPTRFRGGVTVAQGDVNGDGVPEIITGTMSGVAVVRVFNGVTGDLVRQFLPFGARFKGGVNVAFGYLDNGSKNGDIIAGTASGLAFVKVFDAGTLNVEQRFLAYRGPVNGVHVAAANLDGGYASDVITAPGAGARPVVKAFDLGSRQPSMQFLAYDPHYRGGVNVASGDFDHNAVPDIVTSPDRGAPLIRVWSSGAGNPMISQFLADTQSAHGGAEVGVVHTGDSSADEIAVTRPSVSGDPASGVIISVFNLSGTLLGTQTVPGAGRRGVALSSAPQSAVSSYSGPKIHAIDYNPTWPNWSSQQYASQVTSATSTTLTDTTQNFVTNVFAQQSVVIYAGTGTGQTRTISSNTSNTLTVSTPWATTPDNTSRYTITTNQLQDSDFFNAAFQGLWGTAATNQGRNDLSTMQNTGFNLVRLYNWGPTRGWNGSSGTDHLGFLNQALADGMTVMVPVSDYFLGNDQYAWNGQNPDASYSFGSAPQAIQQDLLDFISSITENGEISPAVHSISVGNEFDLGIDNDPGNTAKLQRALWWVVNLHDQIVKQFGATASHPLITIPVSNADQGTPSPAMKSWFQEIVHGVSAGAAMPTGAVPGGTFTANVTGLDAYSWYTDWYFNSVNMFQTGSQLTNTLKQYDTGVATGTAWNQMWPGEKFDVPLLITELGTSRFNIGGAAQFDVVANQQAQVVENFMKTSHNIMGYTIFEFNDEPNKNNYSGASPISESLFGITKYYNTSNQNDFRNGTLQYSLNTGTTQVSFGQFPNYVYPVYQLYDVQSGGVTLLNKLKSIFASG